MTIIFCYISICFILFVKLIFKLLNILKTCSKLIIIISFISNIRTFWRKWGFWRKEICKRILLRNISMFETFIHSLSVNKKVISVSVIYMYSGRRSLFFFFFYIKVILIKIIIFTLIINITDDWWWNIFYINYIYNIGKK